MGLLAVPGGSLVPLARTHLGVPVSERVVLSARGTSIGSAWADTVVDRREGSSPIHALPRRPCLSHPLTPLLSPSWEQGPVYALEPGCELPWKAALWGGARAQLPAGAEPRSCRSAEARCPGLGSTWLSAAGWLLGAWCAVGGLRILPPWRGRAESHSLTCSRGPRR